MWRVKFVFIIVSVLSFQLAAQTACDNEDFELSTASPVNTYTQIQGWWAYNGTVSVGANCSITSSTYTNNVASALITAGSSGYIDPIIGAQYPLYSVFGSAPNNGLAVNPAIGNMYGTNFLRIGDAIGNYSVDRINKRIKVTAANSVFKYAYIFVGYPSNHPCCDAALFRIVVTDITTNSVLSNYTANILVPTTTPQCISSPSVAFFIGGTNNPHNPTSFQPVYTKWKTNMIDFSPFIGDSLSIDFIAMDCSGGAHYGYSYIDAACSSAQIYVNGNMSTSSSATVCNSATLSGPPNLNYLWNGPASSSITNVTTQSITTNANGIYTLTLMSGTTVVDVQTLSLTMIYSTPITVFATQYTICAGESTKLDVLGNSVYSYTWSTGYNGSYHWVTPTVTTLYTVTITNGVGCTSSGMVAINVYTCTGLYAGSAPEGILKIYPNPNNGDFTIRANESRTIEIFDMMGKLIEKIELESENNFEAHLRNYAPGIYIVRTRVRTYKIIITK